MITAWLDLPVPAVLATLAVVLLAWCLLLHIVTFYIVPRERMLRYNGLVAPFFTGLAVMFALLTGFVANDAWERNRQASRAILTERDGLLNVYYLSVAASSDMAAIRAAEREYIERVVRDDWPRMADPRRTSQAGAALGALLSLVADPRIEKAAGGSVHDALLQSVIKIRTARYDRLAISADHADSLKWTSVVMLALLTMVALALEHLDRARVQLTALVLYSLGVFVALGPVAIREHPFSGAMQIPSTPLGEVLGIMAGNVAGPTGPPAAPAPVAPR